MFDVAWIEIDRPAHSLQQRFHFFFDIVGLPFDVSQLIAIDKPFERKEHAVDKFSHLGGIIVCEVKRDYRRLVIDGSVKRSQPIPERREQLSIRCQDSDEELDRIEATDRTHKDFEYTSCPAL